MRIPERQAIQQAVQRLSEVLAVPSHAVNVSRERSFGNRRVGAVVETGPYEFAIEWKASGSLGNVFRAVHQVHSMATELPATMIPLLVVPYMGESARFYCDELGIAWLDLSGNAKIVAPGLYVHAVGHENKFRRPGRLETAFGSKGSRVARWMLMNPDQLIRQRTLAAAVGLDEGYASRVVRRLVEMGLLERVEGGLRVPDPANLLDAWRDEYRFEKHTVKQGHIAVAAGESVVPGVADVLAEANAEYAVTGLAAAWYLTRYATYRLSTLYLKTAPSTELLEALQFRETSRGSNTWLVVPQDEGVFSGVTQIERIFYVHPVQVYLDLKSHPERANEAAEELRGRLLRWDTHDR